MKNMKKWLFAAFFILSITTVFAQGKISGIIQDNNGPLPGANVVIEGTSTGTSTGFDGSFTLNSTTSNGNVVVSFLGFSSKTVPFTIVDGKADLGTIVLSDEGNVLGEVIIRTSVIDLAKDRKTPVAVSTIKAAEIQSKVGTADVTQALVNTPSVYVAGQSGGYGDSRITVRGFQQDNTAFLLNGQPINGMEDGKMYWSNWSGMSDIASLIQIQRGLGSSKLAISSVGGTVNFVTKATDKKEGGFISAGIATGEYFKTTAAYSTGEMKNGFGASVMLSHWQGDGYNAGTRAEGQNYFLSFGYKLNEKHNFNLLLTGAPQYHDQNFSKPISTYLKYGKRYNDNWGTLNGRYLSERTNFYHKPVANLNWDYDINNDTQLSTVLYASWGRGGGTGNYGSGRVRTSSGQIDFDKIYENNLLAPNNNGNFTNTPRNYLIRASMNNHSWYGLVSNLKTKLNENLSFNAGIDLRSYYGTHYRQVSNFLGLNSWTESRNLRGENHNFITPTLSVSNTVTESLPARPWEVMFNTLDENQRIDYDYSERISYGGVFTQLEFSKNNFSAFFQGSISEQIHQRFDRYDYKPEFEKSEKIDNLGYNAKGGVSYKFLDKHGVYANAGYYSRQPYHDNIYLNFTNQVNPLTENEKILGLEVGYSFNSSMFSASVNGYRTTWDDRVVSSSFVQASNGTIGTTPVQAGDLIYRTNQAVQQIHTGVELDFVFRPIKKLDVKGFASFGNWEYVGESVTSLRDESLTLLSETKTDVDGGKVGDAAQTTFGAGLNYNIVKGLSVDADYRNYSKLYANAGTVKENLELPSYSLVDAGLTLKLNRVKDSKDFFTLRFNINNVLNEEYLSESSTNVKAKTRSDFSTDAAFQNYQNTGLYKGIDVSNQVYFGFGRTWNFTFRYNF